MIDNPMPQVGDPATYVIGSDRYGGTIVEVTQGGRRVGFQQDNETLVEGSRLSEYQVYTYERNPRAEIQYFSLRKSGRYRPVGERDVWGASLSIGARNSYRDPSF